MTPEKIAEAMEVMAEAQSEEPPEGEPRVPCDVAANTFFRAPDWRAAKRQRGRAA